MLPKHLILCAQRKCTDNFLFFLPDSADKQDALSQTTKEK